MTTEFECPPEHKHGASGTCYNNHKCRCRGCRDSRAAHAREVTRQKAYGTYDSGFVDADPVRDHIAVLRASGLGRRRIATLAGVQMSTIEALLYCRRGGTKKRTRLKSPSVRVATRNAQAILALQPDIRALAGNALVPSRGAQRRIQALIACGWSSYKITSLLGQPGRFNSAGKILRQDRITAATFRRIAELYETLWDKTPPHTEPHDRAAYVRSINRAAAAGWPKPLDWDDIDTDEGPARGKGDNSVDAIAVELAIAGNSIRLNHAEKLEGLRQMHPKKWSNGLIAERLGCEERTVLRLREELDLPGWDQSELVGRRAA